MCQWDYWEFFSGTVAVNCDAIYIFSKDTAKKNKKHVDGIPILCYDTCGKVI